MSEEEQEAIEILKKIRNSLYVDEYHYDWQLAIDTILNYIDKLQKQLDNSISREKVKKLAEKTKHYANSYDCITADYKQSQGIGEYMAYIKLLNNKE